MIGPVAWRRTATAVLLLALGGCVTVQPYDYTNYRQHPPRSILVLPPLNQSIAVQGGYSYLSTVSQPLAEHGYYVFPVAVIDQYLKDNGMPTAGEMHQVPLNKVAEVIGADAVLYLTLEQYGSKYQLVSANSIVTVSARLVDTRSGILLWDGRATAQNGSSGSGNIFADLIAAAITQAINSKTDSAHAICPQANVLLFEARDRGLPYGPYSPRYQSH
jgi:hypothetical protein